MDISQRGEETTTGETGRRAFFRRPSLLNHTHLRQPLFSVRGKLFNMSQRSFVFTPMALRSLELDEDMLQRYKYKKQLTVHHLNSYMLRKEVRDRELLRSSAVRPAAICHDVVVQNALYTGDLEAMQRLFPRGSTASLIIEPQGGDMRWVATGEGRRRHLSSSGINLEIHMIWHS